MKNEKESIQGECLLCRFGQFFGSNSIIRRDMKMKKRFTMQKMNK
jgi:hypothetical protein